jgi:hypothetical protein
VVVVNESWVRRYSADRDPLGRRVWLVGRMFEVVGVVPDLQMQDPEDRAGDGMYASMLQANPYAVRLVARAAGEPLALTPGIRDAIEAVDPDLPLFEVANLHEAIYADKKVLEAFGVLFLVFGTGRSSHERRARGVVSFAVSRRAREISIGWQSGRPERCDGPGAARGVWSGWNGDRAVHRVRALQPWRPASTRSSLRACPHLKSSARGAASSAWCGRSGARWRSIRPPCCAPTRAG